MSETQEVTILLVEDDPGHARLIEKNLRRSNLANDIVTIGNGQQALDYLFGEGEYTADIDPDAADIDRASGSMSAASGGEHPSPLLVLLDLNLPVLDGYQVLERMKTDGRTKHIPVIVLTTTDDAREVSRCYDLGCSVYVTKPVDYEQFSEAIRQLGLFLSVVTVPEMKKGI